MRRTVSASQTLDRDAVGFWQLTYQSISLIAPAGAMAATLTGAAVYARGALPLAMLAGVITAGLMINTTLQFAKSIASAGGFYNYIAHGLGSRWAVYGAFLFLISYFNILTNATIFVGGVFLPGVFHHFLGIASPEWLWWPVTLLFYGVVLLLALKGIRPSLRYAVWTGTVEIVVLLALSVLLIVYSPHPVSWEVLNPLWAKGGLSGFGHGVLIAMFAVSGSSAAVALGEETRSPQKRIRWAVIAAFLFSSVLFLLMAYALTVAWGYTQMGSFARSLVPGAILIQKVLHSSVLAWFILLLIANSMLAGSLAPLLSCARMIFALSRDGIVFPERLGQTDARRNPSQALIMTTLAAAALSLCTGFWLGPFHGYILLITLSSLGLFLGHILANCALGPFSRKTGQSHWLLHWVIPTMASLLIAAAMVLTLVPPSARLALAPLFIFFTLGIVWLRLRRVPPEKIAAAGHFNVIDEISSPPL
jgi:amino acid transporter